MRKTFEISLENFYEVLSWLHQQIEPIPEKTLKEIDLAFEEAVVNIIHYAYSDQTGEIALNVTKTADQLDIEISDWGPPFNPLERKSGPNTSDSLEARELGKLGIFFIKTYIDEIQYKRVSDQNCLTLTKNLS